MVPAFRVSDTCKLGACLEYLKGVPGTTFCHNLCGFSTFCLLGKVHKSAKHAFKSKPNASFANENYLKNIAQATRVGLTWETYSRILWLPSTDMLFSSRIRKSRRLQKAQGILCYSSTGEVWLKREVYILRPEERTTALLGETELAGDIKTYKALTINGTSFITDSGDAAYRNLSRILSS